MLSYLIKHFIFKNHIPHLPFSIVDATRSISTHNDWMMFFILLLSFIDSLFNILSYLTFLNAQYGGVLSLTFYLASLFPTWTLLKWAITYQIKISLLPQRWEMYGWQVIFSAVPLSEFSPLWIFLIIVIWFIITWLAFILWGSFYSF